MDFHGNIGFGASPARSSVWCSPAGALFFRRKTSLLIKNMIYDDFQTIFHQNGPNLLSIRGTIVKTGILTPNRILVGTLNPWNGRPRVDPWPIWLERLAKKSPVNHHYSWVWCSCQQASLHRSRSSHSTDSEIGDYISPNLPDKKLFRGIIPRCCCNGHFMAGGYPPPTHLQRSGGMWLQSAIDYLT